MATRRLRSRPSTHDLSESGAIGEAGTISDAPEGTATTEHLPVLQVGRRVGRYRLCGEVASGGMATVHVALLEGAAGFEKVVALKAIHPHLAKKTSFVQMFLDEARIASRLEHPNVCHVFDFGQEDGGYYLAMEYLVGVTLSRLIEACRSRQLDTRPRYVDVVARILADAAEGLHAAHELTDAEGRSLHIVHRDVSPHNVYVTYAGITKVVDFGIAQAKNKLHQTHTGEVKGNFPYVAPEQIAGRVVTRQADVWSLGVVAWEMLSGRSLFKRNTNVETMFAVTQDPIPSLRHERPHIPEGMDRAILKALSRTAEHRHESARRFGRELLENAPNPLTSADLSELMDVLFPGEQARTRSFVAHAMELRPERSWRKAAGLGLAGAAAFGAAAYLALVGLPTAEPTRADRNTMATSTTTPSGATVDAPASARAPTAESDPLPGPEATAMRAGRGERSDRRSSVNARPGQLNLVTSGASSEVLYRGRSLGWTPLSTRLPAGSYALTIRPPDGPTRRVRVRIRPGGTTRRTVTLR